MTDRISQDNFLKGVKKQQAIIRQLFASKKRRNEVLSDLARQRYGWMTGKFFDIGSSELNDLPAHTVCCVSDIKAQTANVYDDKVLLLLECKVVVPRTEHGEMVNLNCHTEEFCFDYTEDLETTLADKWVGWEVADKRLFDMTEAMCLSYGIKYDRLAIALDKIKSLHAALDAKDETHRKELVAKDETHRKEMEGMVRLTGEFWDHLHCRLCADYEQANSMISWASRASKPLKDDEGGLIKVESSADSIIKFIKKELGIIKEE